MEDDSAILHSPHEERAVVFGVAQAPGGIILIYELGNCR